VHITSTLWPSGLESDLDDGHRDITFYLHPVVTNSDRILKHAELQFGPRVELVLGLRSSILDSFERFLPLEGEHHLPCDVPGLTIGLALLIVGRRFGIIHGSISNGGLGELRFVFENENMQELSIQIQKAFSSWNSWLVLMMDALQQEPIDGNWSFEWREFLSGESGYVTMDWYQSIPDGVRGIALNHLVQTSKSVLRSLLSTRQYAEKDVLDFIIWLESIKPLPFVVGYPPKPEIQEVWT
jgi:hypothetical protein